MLSLAALALPAIFAGLVSAHGNVDNYVIEGVNITGYLPYQDPYVTGGPPDRAMRNFPGNGPVQDITIADVRCNQGAEAAKLINTIAAGETVQLHWTAWPDSHVGPVLTYMARAPDGTNITEWDASDAQWFKIDHQGYTSGVGWAATDVLTYKQNSIWTSTIPANLKAGQYLLRHEIIALHSAGTYPGAQLYMECIQLDVTGSGTALPTSGLVEFPGAYGTADAPGPGIVFNVYSGGDLSTYPIPGPDVWDGVSDTIGSGNSGSATGSATATATASSTAAPSATVTSATPTDTATAVPTDTVSSTDSAIPTDTASSTYTAVPTDTASSTDEPAPTSTDSAIPTDTAVPTSSTDEPAPTSTNEPVPSSTDEPAPSSTDAPAPSSTDAPAPTTATATTAAPTATSTGVVNANTCWDTYNKCIAASQPNPDWTGCSTTRDSCLTNAKYMRLARSGTVGRRLAFF